MTARTTPTGPAHVVIANRAICCVPVGYNEVAGTSSAITNTDTMRAAVGDAPLCRTCRRMTKR